LFDGDAAGQRAAERSIEVFFSFPVDVRICNLPDKLDPDELLRQEHGHERFEEAVNQATDALESMVGVFRAQLDAADGVTARTRIVETTLARLSSLGMDDLSTIRRRFVVDSIAEILRVSPAEIERMAAPTRSRFQPAEPDAMIQDDVKREPVVRAPMAQRAAEEQLLQLILADPTVVLELVRFDDDTTMNVVEKFPPSRLEDPLCRMAWESIRERATSGELPDGPDLVAGVANDEAGRLASKLYLNGLRQLEISGEPAIKLLELASNQLESLIGVLERRAARTEATTRPISDPDAALEALNAIRAAGFDPTTVPKIPGHDPPQQTDHGQYA
jgi:DNA primase